MAAAADQFEFTQINLLEALSSSCEEDIYALAAATYFFRYQSSTQQGSDRDRSELNFASVQLTENSTGKKVIGSAKGLGDKQGAQSTTRKHSEHGALSQSLNKAKHKRWNVFANHFTRASEFLTLEDAKQEPLLTHLKGLTITFFTEREPCDYSRNSSYSDNGCREFLGELRKLGIQINIFCILRTTTPDRRFRNVNDALLELLTVVNSEEVYSLLLQKEDIRNKILEKIAEKSRLESNTSISVSDQDQIQVLKLEIDDLHSRETLTNLNLKKIFFPKEKKRKFKSDNDSDNDDDNDSLPPGDPPFKDERPKDGKQTTSSQGSKLRKVETLSGSSDGRLTTEQQEALYGGMGIKEEILPSKRKGIPNISVNQLALNPDFSMLSAALEGGDCFFDAFAQAVNALQKTELTAKSLRQKCYDYYSTSEDNKREINKLHEETYTNKTNVADYTRMQYTKDDLDKNFDGIAPLWGRPHIEGKILCKALGLEGMIVIEIIKDPETSNLVLNYLKITTQNGEQKISIEQANELIDKAQYPVLAVTQEDLHFVPLLPKQKLNNEQQIVKNPSQIHPGQKPNTTPVRLPQPTTIFGRPPASLQQQHEATGRKPLVQGQLPTQTQKPHPQIHLQPRPPTLLFTPTLNMLRHPHNPPAQVNPPVKKITVSSEEMSLEEATTLSNKLNIAGITQNLITHTRANDQNSYKVTVESDNQSDIDTAVKIIRPPHFHL